MKKTYRTLLIYVIPILVLCSCDQYLDVAPKGKRLLETVKDYDSWLNNGDVETSTPMQLNYLSDFTDKPTIPTTLTSSNDMIYTWQSQFSETVPGSAILWSNYYSSIYLFNAVIANVLSAKDGTDQEKLSLRAEGLLGRAYEYLGLVNLYGKQYDSETASTDLAVPFVTSIDVTDPVPGRSTVQEIYDHIIADINEAIPDLPEDNSQNRFRGSLAAGYAVLARTYLYMGNFSKAAENAQLALNNGPDKILDYTTITDAKGIPHLMKRSDAIYARLGGISYLGKDLPTVEFLKTFNKKDLRLTFFYNNLGDYSFPTRGKVNFVHAGVPSGYAYPNWGLSVAEMHLIIAEAEARANHLPEAINHLDIIRKCRFKAADYTKFVSDNQEEVLQKVLSERTYELSFCGLRWFDMRRLNAEGRMPEIRRYDGLGNVVASLTPGSNKYILQIPIQVLYFNPDWEQNPE
ncbi:MAG: RagB/SusD family nutrient uptake outer membrane protein [Bacteroidales bacterium]|jgi:tetratricopeptide (TPR) repeat protein|nr:RagB/SusD family nutrient uptake outer membrane protein [Bacteroidales bacterium]